LICHLQVKITLSSRLISKRLQWISAKHSKHVLIHLSWVISLRRCKEKIFFMRRN